MKYLFLPTMYLMLAACSGCWYNPVISVPHPKPYPTARPPQMTAGIAQTDLTLPPGYPMAGYSINGRISRGYWVRPQATALYLLDTARTPFVFVTTDLWAITEGQKMAVLKALSEDPATWFIGENELLLTATHTHHSSGAIELDKAFASTSIGFGIDKAAFAFTVRQIVSAIKKAILSADAATVSYATDTVNGIAKNRSLTPYFQNNPVERQDFIPEKQAPETNRFYLSKAEIESTIEKWLSVITVRDLNGKTKGILASFPMHPTATGDATEVYSADVFGLASAQASAAIQGQPIVAFYNGAEGDVAPEYRFHQRYDAVRIADSLSKAIKRASESGSQVQLTGIISHRTEIIDIASNQAALNRLDQNCYTILPPVARTSGSAMAGAAVLAGASDGRTSLSSFGISDGVRSKKWDPEQGHKLSAVTFLGGKVWPHIIPWWVALAAKKYVKITPKPKLHISIHQVGDVYFAGLPGEFTTMMGRRIKRTIAASLKSKERTISLVGLADAYVSYVTTPCEYEAQYYEGASNFYGISTGAVFENEYRKLATAAQNDSNDRLGRKNKFKGGKKVTFGPKYLGDLQVWNANEGLHNLMVSANGYHVDSREIPPLGEVRENITEVDSNEVIVYSFKDRVNTIESVRFYPDLKIRTPRNTLVDLPEHILTVDRYAGTESKWTVRILNTTSFADGGLWQIVVTPLSGAAVPPSNPFRLKRTGTR